MAAAAWGGTYYVAPTGSADGDGSRERPWPSVAHALGRVGGGQTVVLLPGLYRGPIRLEAAWAGTAASPTVVRAETKWQAVIIGSEVNGVWTEEGCDWVVIEGLRCHGARFDGIKLLSDHSTVRDCWVHSNGTQGLASHGRRDNAFLNNLVEYNGTHPYYHHGIYADGERLTVRGNIVRHNSAYGLHLYSKLSDSLIAGNLVYGQASCPAVIIAAPDGGGRNRILHNTFVSPGTTALALTHAGGDTVAGNILVGKFGAVSHYQQSGDIVADYNLCVPQDAAQGPHGLTGEPGFMDPEHGVYWLREDSRARGKGSLAQALEQDFWGRPLDRTQPPDLGCFAFVATLTRPETRQGWYYQWPYEFYPNREMGMPDLWQAPH